MGDSITRLHTLSERYNTIQDSINEVHRSERELAILRSRRIIVSTTTAAAMQIDLIRAAYPDVVLVEEAGEILESHVLAALTPSVRRLLLIGDHKQLRPKVDNYRLTVEAGEGFDPNRSLFERLVLQGHRFHTLSRQHRMHPDISVFPRHMTYPELSDGELSAQRERIRGLTDRVIFIDHDNPEAGAANGLRDRRDAGAGGAAAASKENVWEALMARSVVRYLVQQGYGPKDMVVLTPYLGQVCRLNEVLKNDFDPLLSELDLSELIRAGLMSLAASKVGQKPLRISTIGELLCEWSLANRDIA